MVNKRQSLVNVIVSAIVIAFYCGCSEDNSPIDTGEVSDFSTDITGGGAGAGAMGAAGGTLANPTGGTAAPQNIAGIGGSPTTKATGGKGGSVGMAGKAGGLAGTSTAGAGGKAGSAGGKAGQSGAAGTEADPCGANAKTVTGATSDQGYGNTQMRTSGDVEVLKLTTTMLVPKTPSPTGGTLFLWPGLQPLNYNSGRYGVLQPVLTWGTSCSPSTSMTYDHWWISGMYVGMGGGSLGIGCDGGDALKLKTGDKIDIEMVLGGTTWTQAMTNRSTGETVDFPYDLEGQKQQWVLFQIELVSSTKPVDDVIFIDTVVKFSGSQPNSCVPNVKGAEDYFSPPRVSSDGKTCCISKIILRAQGIAASSPDEP